jgi:hypothetical protein
VLKTVLSDASTLRRWPAGCHCDREDLHLRSEPGERIHRRADISGAVYRGTAGVSVHQLIPGVPLGLAFTCVFAAVPGALVAAPFSVVLLAAFVSQVGGLQTAPVLIAVATAYLTMEGVKYVAASRKAARAPKGKAAPAAQGAADAPA